MTDYFDRLVERTGPSSDAVMPVRRLEPDDLAGPTVVDEDPHDPDSAHRIGLPDRNVDLGGEREVRVVEQWTVPAPGDDVHTDPDGRATDGPALDRRPVEPSEGSERLAPPELADREDRAPSTTGRIEDVVRDEPPHVVEVAHSSPPTIEPPTDGRSADGASEHPVDAESMSHVPGLAEMDRVLFGQAGLTSPWEDSADTEADDATTDEHDAEPVSSLDPEQSPDRPEPISYVEHVPVPAPEPSTAPPPPEPTVTIGSIRIEIVEPPPAAQPVGRAAPRARAHLGSSRQSRRTWGW